MSNGTPRSPWQRGVPNAPEGGTLEQQEQASTTGQSDG